MGLSISEFENGQRTFPAIDRLVVKLLGYGVSDYYSPEAVPPRMLPMTKWVKSNGGESIFPGGCGVYGPALARGGVMLLFQDYDVEASYRVAVESGYTKNQTCASRLACKVLREAGVDLATCFLTNRFLGVRDAENQYGPNPGWRSSDEKRQYKPYIDMCDAMLKAQFAELEPRLIVTFGIHVPKSLGFADLWQKKLIKQADLFGHSVTIAALTHTSLRHLNIAHVKYEGLTGHEAEIKVLRDALQAANLQ
jgi:hypothetical protein